jgi:drug/metabolite transporter (DMT)-like permease
MPAADDNGIELRGDLLVVFVHGAHFHEIAETCQPLRSDGFPPPRASVQRKNRRLEATAAGDYNSRMQSLATADDETQRRKRTARLTILIAAVLWSTSGFFAKATIFDNWPSDGWLPTRGLLLVFWRALFATAVLLPMVRRPTFTWKLAPMAIVFALMNVMYLSAMVRTTAANAIWLQNTAPIVVFVVGTTLLGDPIHRRDWPQMIFIALGLAFILTFELQQPASSSGDSSFIGVIFGLASGVTYAGVVLSLRWLRGEDAAWLVAVNHAVTALVMLPFVLTHTQYVPTLAQLGFLAAFGILQMGVPYLLFARAVRVLPGHEAAGIVLLEPLLMPLWVWLAWDEVPRWWTFVGALFIFTGLMIRYFPAIHFRQHNSKG